MGVLEVIGAISLGVLWQLLPLGVMTRRSWRQGIGRLLFEAARLAAKEKGYEKFIAFVRADNVSGLAYYKRIGFEAIGVAKRHAKIKGRYIDEVLIERQL
jgi:ribosomal protein S18 acetylase RimI-like enzyme